jgi:hypothetical protein
MSSDNEDDEDVETFIAQIHNNAVDDFSDRIHNNCVRWTRDESFARRLGTALQHNTSIDFLKVTVDLLNRTTLHEAGGSEHFYNPLIDYVRNSTSLHDFSFWFEERSVENANVHCQLLTKIAEAVATNSSITKLELMCFMDSDDYRDDMNEVIAQLACRHHLETLQEIQWGLCFVDANELESSIPMALDTFFRARSTNLKMLRLWNVEIDAECCNHLFGTWQTSYAARAEMVILEDCVFTHDGSEYFGKLMESSRQHEILRGDKSGCGNEAVVNVHLEMSESSNAADICALPSCFQSLFLVSTTGRIRVCELHMNIMSRVHLPILAHYLPYALYLQRLFLVVDRTELTEEWSADEEKRARDSCGLSAEAFQFPISVLCQQVLDGIRCNGSLTRFELSPEGNVAAHFFSAAMERKVDAYLGRNRIISCLLSAAETDIALLPTLFAAAIVARTMAPTNLLIGLSTARSPTGELLLGPRQGSRSTKRCNA